MPFHYPKKKRPTINRAFFFVAMKFLSEFVEVERFDFESFTFKRREDDVLRIFLRINASRHNFGTVVDENFNRGLVEENAELEDVAEECPCRLRLCCRG